MLLASLHSQGCGSYDFCQVWLSKTSCHGEWGSNKDRLHLMEEVLSWWKGVFLRVDLYVPFPKQQLFSIRGNFSGNIITLILFVEPVPWAMVTAVLCSEKNYHVLICVISNRGFCILEGCCTPVAGLSVFGTLGKLWPGYSLNSAFQFLQWLAIYFGETNKHPTIGVAAPIKSQASYIPTYADFVYRGYIPTFWSHSPSHYSL